MYVIRSLMKGWLCLLVATLVIAAAVVACADTMKQTTTPPATTTEALGWAPDMDCSTCHVMVPYLESVRDANLLVYVHAKKGLTCLDCHELAVLQQVHKRYTPNTTSLQERKFPTDFCLRCHGSYKKVLQLTEGLDPNPHDSHYGEMRCGACHKMHRPSEYFCARCHLPPDLGPEWKK